MLLKSLLALLTLTISDQSHTLKNLVPLDKAQLGVVLARIHSNLNGDSKSYS